MTAVRRNDLVYPELSYQILGCVFAVYNELGPGQSEKTYHKALLVAFQTAGLRATTQVYRPVFFQDKIVGKNFFDILVEDKIIVELKKNSSFSRNHIQQVLRYLKTDNRKLAILVNFGTHGVQYKRIINQ